MYHILSLASRVGFVKSMERWASLQRGKKYLLMGCFTYLTLHHALNREQAWTGSNDTAASCVIMELSKRLSWFTHFVMALPISNYTYYSPLLPDPLSESCPLPFAEKPCCKWGTTTPFVCLCVCVCVCVCVMNEIVVGLPNHQPLLGNLESMALPLFVSKFSNIPKLPKGNTIF
jgi:hypothetical protein